MPSIKIWIHCVWATKNRARLLHQTLRASLFEHIGGYARNNRIFIDCINGGEDHVHLLLSLGGNQQIDRVMQMIKGESSYWINKNHLSAIKFGWQDDYFVVSVSESQLDNVRGYIARQDDHHRYKTFEEEYQEFLEKFRFDQIR